MENIQEYINCIQSVPSLPSVVERAMSVLNDPESSSNSLATIISLDAGISSRVLKIVNSAYFGLPCKISRITQAIVLLGFAEIRNVILTTSIFSMFTGSDQYYRKNMVRHSIYCALGSKVVANRIKGIVPEDAFMAGLLHDIGKFVVAEYFPYKFNTINKLLNNETITILEAEEAVLGINHMKIGEMLCDKWRFPLQIQEAVAHHHCLNDSTDHQQLVAIVYLEDLLVNMIDVPNQDLRNIHIHPNCLKVLGLTIDELVEIFGQIYAKIDESFEILKMI